MSYRYSLICLETQTTRGPEFALARAHATPTATTQNTPARRMKVRAIMATRISRVEAGYDSGACRHRPRIVRREGGNGSAESFVNHGPRAASRPLDEEAVSARFGCQRTRHQRSPEI